MLCSWEGNRMLGIALVTWYRIQWLVPWGLRPKTRENYTAYDSVKRRMDLYHIYERHPTQL